MTAEWATVAVAGLGFLGLLVPSILSLLRQRRAEELLRNVHVLVNSQHGKVLAAYAASARARAEMTKDPRHTVEAEDAERALTHHVAQQWRIDNP